MDTQNDGADDAYNLAIVNIMKHAKLDSGDTFPALAEKTGISVVTIKRLLAGERSFKMGQFISLCVALGLDPGEVVDQAAGASASEKSA